ncbi:MAG: RnfABCDGE type electron transport complex subunit G [Butyrivibrio sp.]|jgi:electron transport complex protein RnfG|nr:RnfABCDGE type electron transport complex subunit G [Butyrivibrio sp.]
MSETRQMVKNAMILFVITLVAGVLLGIVYQVTKAPIAYQEQLAETKANQEVFPDAASFEDMELDAAQASKILAGDTAYAKVEINSVKAAKDSSGKTLGYVLQVTSGGYGDDIVFTMGLTDDGTLNGISLISINETPGLGMNAQKVLVPQFKGAATDKLFEVTKTDATSDNQIEAISGATITSKAVTNGVNAGVLYFQNVLKGAQS